MPNTKTDIREGEPPRRLELVRPSNEHWFVCFREARETIEGRSPWAQAYYQRRRNREASHHRCEVNGKEIPDSGSLALLAVFAS